MLYDYLNNGELLQPDTVTQLLQLAEMLQVKNYDEASRLQVEIQTTKTDECENWMVSIALLQLQWSSANIFTGWRQTAYHAEQEHVAVGIEFESLCY